MNIIKYFLAILLIAPSTQACQQAPAPAGSPTPQAPSPYVLGPDDQIKIWALGVEEISDKPMRIDPGGFIDLPVIGRIHAGGLTVEQSVRAFRTARSP